MSAPYAKLFTPLQVGALNLDNRIVMGSMHTGLEDSGKYFYALARFYEERAKGGVGLIITGGFSPNRSGWLVPLAGKLTQASEVKTHKILTETVHRYPTKIFMQILHAGRYAMHPLAAAPSAIKSPISPFKPWMMSEKNILSTIEDFAVCAALAKEAGYDGVEIMGSEGYLINQFLALRTNHREDHWGGSFENRSRFAVEIVKQTRAKVGPNFSLMFRLSLLDLVENGSSLDERIQLAKILEASGVDILNSGIGWHESKIPTIATMVPRGAFAWATKKLKENVKIPVVAANRINNPEDAENILKENAADLISMARPFLADAEFSNKAKNNQKDLINTCIACNQACLDHIFKNKRATCLVNPRACYETEFEIKKAAISKNVAVIGAGPAGLSFAITAAQRGHKVTVFEASQEIGGQFNLACRIPGKEEFKETLRYYKKQIENYKINLVYNTKPEINFLKEQKFDEIVISSGTVARKVSFPGSDSSNFVHYADIISGKVSPKNKIAIIGAGGIGFDTATFLVKNLSNNFTDLDTFLNYWGVDKNTSTPGALKPQEIGPPQRKIYLLQRKTAKFGANLGKTTGWIHRKILADAQIEMINSVEYVKFDTAGLHLKVQNKEKVLDVEQVIVCAGQESNNSYVELQKYSKHVHVIGGAHQVNELDAKNAILEGMKLAIKI